jgi:hypothetical protein
MRVAFLVFCLVVVAGRAAAQEQNRIGSWEISRLTDPITDEAIVNATAPGSNGAVVVKCVSSGKRHMLSVSFVSRDFLGTSGQVGNLVWRVDAAPPVHASWNVDARGSQIWVEKPKNADPFLRALFNSDKLLIRATRFDFSEVNAEIAIKGASEALRVPLDACQRPEIK